MPYQPALDGVRALAVVMVLLFHAHVAWMPGGYIGVSVFFTLSGYLITTLLLTERAGTGRIDARRFYVRRIRRLLPASLVAVTGILVLTATGAIDARSTFRGDVLAVLLQVKNWAALVGEESYADLFARSSPLDHFWSLSIEEQFYAVWPLTIVGVTAWAWRSRRPRRRVTIAIGLLFAGAALSAPLTAAMTSPNVAYLASWSRFAEILAGAVLAAAMLGRRVPRAVGLLAPLALAVVLALGVVSPATGGWAYGGGLPLFAVVSAALLAGLQVRGPVTTLLSLAPLVWLGRVSYGLYLYHWPVYVVLDETRTGLDGARLLALRLGATVAVAAISAHLIELPIRQGRRIVGDRRLVAGIAAAVAILAATVVVTWPGGTPGRRVLADAPASAIDDSALVEPGADVPLEVVMFGDSVAHTLAGGVVHDYPFWDPWDPLQSMADPHRMRVTSVAKPACSYLAGELAPLRPDGTRGRADLSNHCGAWRAETVAALASSGPGSYLVVVLTNDIHDRWGPGGELIALGSDSWLRLLDGFLADLGRLAADHDSELVLVGLPPRGYDASEGERDRELATYLGDHAESAPGVRYVDFGPVVDQHPELRTDGLHYSRDGAALFSAWLADQLGGPAERRPAGRAAQTGS